MFHCKAKDSRHFQTLCLQGASVKLASPANFDSNVWPDFACFVRHVACAGMRNSEDKPIALTRIIESHLAADSISLTAMLARVRCGEEF